MRLEHEVGHPEVLVEAAKLFDAFVRRPDDELSVDVDLARRGRRRSVLAREAPGAVGLIAQHAALLRNRPSLGAGVGDYQLTPEWKSAIGVEAVEASLLEKDRTQLGQLLVAGKRRCVPCIAELRCPANRLLGLSADPYRRPFRLRRENSGKYVF